jgi:hypothetical protein
MVVLQATMVYWLSITPEKRREGITILPWREEEGWGSGIGIVTQVFSDSSNWK